MRTKFFYACSFTAALLGGCAAKTTPSSTSDTGGASSNCPMGSERCDCYGNGTCDLGLECHSNLCVVIEGAGGATTMGTSGVGGSYSSGGASYPMGTVGGYTTASGGLYSTSTGGSQSTGTGGSYSAITGGTGLTITGGSASTGTSGGTTPGIDLNYCDGLLAGENCGQSSARADVHTVNMMIVIDQSGSMKDTASVTGTQSKWVELNSALSTMLKPVASDINFGLILYPYSGDIAAPGIDSMSSDPKVACNVPNGDDPNAGVAVNIAPGLDNANEILNVLKTSVPGGGTPTAKALEQALKYYTQGNGRDLTGLKRVMLVTDGGPNCNSENQCEKENCTQNIDCKCGDGCGTSFNCCAPNGGNDYGYICLDDAATVAQIDKLAQAGIKTFVVGLPGAESYVPTLNAMAEAGKVPNQNGANGESYYAVSATNSLQSQADTFAMIASQLVNTCDIELPESPPDPKRVIVTVDCHLLPLVPSETPPSGGDSGFWIDYSISPAHLKLTGSYCASIQAGVAVSIDVITGCQGIS